MSYLKYGTGAVVALTLLACGPKERTAALEPERPTKEIQYVAVDESVVREKPDATAPVMMTLKRGESVSILDEQNGWKELRVLGRSGWAPSAELSSTSETATGGDDSSEVRFVVPPSPIYRPGAGKGVILYEASVSPDGIVTAVRTLQNTTGSKELEILNAAELQQARFRPIVQRGERKPFVYEYRVDY